MYRLCSSNQVINTESAILLVDHTDSYDINNFHNCDYNETNISI